AVTQPRRRPARLLQRRVPTGRGLRHPRGRPVARPSRDRLVRRPRGPDRLHLARLGAQPVLPGRRAPRSPALLAHSPAKLEASSAFGGRSPRAEFFHVPLTGRTTMRAFSTLTLVLGLVATVAAPVRAQDAEALRREMEQMRKQFESMQEQYKKAMDGMA